MLSECAFDAMSRTPDGKEFRMLGNTIRVGLFLAAMVAVSGCAKKQDAPTDKAEKAATAAEKGADKAAMEGGDEAAEPAAGTAKPAAPGGPIAKVNGVDIPRDEFDKKYDKMTRAFTKRNKEIPPGLAARYRESILKQLVDKELLDQTIKKENVEVDAKTLEVEFADYKKMFRTDENFDRYLKSSDITEEQIRANIRHNLAVQKLLETRGDLAVTEDEVKAYYDENQKRYEVKEQVRASHILFKVGKKDGEAAAAAAKKKADEVYKLASKPDADFPALAKEHSQGPTAAKGGDLSFFTRGRMVPEFEQKAFSMKVGEVAAPIKTQFGWHIIRVTDRKEGRQRPFDEVKESIEKLLKNKKSRRAKADLLKGIKAEAQVEKFLPEPEKPAAPKAAPGAPMKLQPAKAGGPAKPAAPAKPTAAPAKPSGKAGP